MEKVSRHYNVKDVDMVIAASAIVQNAILKKGFLQTKRSSWAGNYLENLDAEIDTATSDYLGADNAKQLRDATIELYAVQQRAYALASEIKVQIEVDFPETKKEILNTLGYASHYKASSRKDQEALINLLFHFKTNLTPALKQQMIDNGTIEADINEMIAIAQTLKVTDTAQEMKKSHRPLITEEAVIAFNQIYDKAIAVGKIASKFYKGNKTHQALFSFSKLSKTINITKTASPEA